MLFAVWITGITYFDHSRLFEFYTTDAVVRTLFEKEVYTYIYITNRLCTKIEHIKNQSNDSLILALEINKRTVFSPPYHWSVWTVYLLHSFLTDAPPCVNVYPQRCSTF